MENINKTCKDCGEEKSVTDFLIKKGRYTTMCKVCNRIKRKAYRDKPENKEKIKIQNDKWNKENKEYFKKYNKENDRTEHRKKYREDNYEKIQEYSRGYREENKNDINKYLREYRKNNPGKVKGYYENSKDKYKEYYELNKERIRERKNSYFRNRKYNDPLFKLSCNIRTLVNISLTKRGYTKESKTYDIIGLKFEELKEYFETKFEDWMNWDNHGLYNGEFNYGWDIDHIIPLSSAENENDIIKLNHYTNLQPLCCKINREIKKDKNE